MPDGLTSITVTEETRRKFKLCSALLDEPIYKIAERLIDKEKERIDAIPNSEQE